MILRGVKTLLDYFFVMSISKTKQFRPSQSPLRRECRPTNDKCDILERIDGKSSFGDGSDSCNLSQLYPEELIQSAMYPCMKISVE